MEGAGEGGKDQTRKAAGGQRVKFSSLQPSCIQRLLSIRWKPRKVLGRRMMFETVLNVGKPQYDIVIREAEGNVDGLNFLTGTTVDEVNKKAFLGTLAAHTDGGVPNIIINIPEMNAYYFGYLVYFFEKACGISGYMLGVNPFDQPGVEDYKRNMFALLGKSGSDENYRKNLEEKLSDLM